MNQNGYRPQGMSGYAQQNQGWSQSAQAPVRQQTGEYSSFGIPNGAGNMAGASGTGYQMPPMNPSQAAAYQTQMHTGYTTPQVPYIQKTEAPFPQGIQQPGEPANGYSYATPGYSPGYPNPGILNSGYPNQNMANSGYTNSNAMAGGYPPYPQQSGMNGGSYIPQTPYSPGYTSPGYQPPGNIQQGYNAYGQMGRATPPQPVQQEYNPIPLNGGGYVPQKVPVRRQPFQMTGIHLIIMGVILAALFAAGVLIMNNTPLKITLIVLALGTTALLWIKPLANENRRLTYSIVALALCILTAVSFLMKKPEDKTNKSSTSQQTEATSANQNGSTVIQDSTGQVPTPVSEVTATPQIQDTKMMERLVTFFTYWAGNRLDDMLTLCLPSWASKLESPRSTLFGLLANRKLKECTPMTPTGTDADTTRKVPVIAKIDRNNDKPAELYQMTILMVKENNEWYVDPQSLQSYIPVETTDPNITPTPAPTETPAVYPSTLLYYNPKDGEYYHSDPYCRVINSKYTPLQGSFTYAEVNNEPYSKLKPCNACAAPLREQE